MISHIKGKVEEKYDGHVIVDVNGVGYEITIPALDYEAVLLGEERKFFTYHAIRENAEELYGFSSLAAKKIFELLTSVQGVGPKAAIAILSLAEAEEVRNAIANADAGFVAKASGVGKKTAERVIARVASREAALSSSSTGAYAGVSELVASSVARCEPADIEIVPMRSGRKPRFAASWKNR